MEPGRQESVNEGSRKQDVRKEKLHTQGQKVNLSVRPWIDNEIFGHDNTKISDLAKLSTLVNNLNK